MHTDFSKVASRERIDKTINALKLHNIDANYFNNAEDAKAFILDLIPKGVEIMNMTSVTMDQIGLVDVIQSSGDYNAVRNKLMAMDRATQGSEMQKLGAAPDWVIGSVHAVTEDGKVMIASNTGSQLPAYASGAGHVIWVVGAQKIVKDTEEGFKRIYEYCLPLESERAKKAYGVPGSSVNKILMVDKEVLQDRITIIIVNEVLGF